MEYSSNKNESGEKVINNPVDKDDLFEEKTEKGEKSLERDKRRQEKTKKKDDRKKKYRVKQISDFFIAKNYENKEETEENAGIDEEKAEKTEIDVDTKENSEKEDVQESEVNQAQDETITSVDSNIESDEAVVVAEVEEESEKTADDEVIENNFEKEQGAAEDTEAIAAKSIELIKEIAEKYSARRPGSKSEKATANLILERTEQALENKGSLEPFYVKKFAYNFGMAVIGALYLIAALTFAFSPLTALIFNCLAIILTVSRIFLKKDLLGVFDKKSIAFNVVNEMKKENAKNTLILTSNYSSARRWNFSGKIKINLKAFAISAIVILLAEFICLAALAFGVVSAGLQAVTGVMLAFIIFFYLGFYNYSKKQGANIANGLSGTGMSFALAEYLKNHKELIGRNTNVIFCCFGGGIDGSAGAKAFIKQHFVYNDDYKKAVLLDFEAVNNDKTALYVDAYHKNNNNFVANKVYEKLSKKSVINKERGILKGFAVTAFNSVGVDSVGIGNSMRILPDNFNNEKDCAIPQPESTKEQLDFYIEIVTEILNELDEQ